MCKTHTEVNNENGSIIIICMVVLLLLTVFGVSAITTTVIETKIAGNERRQQKVFYAAESGWHLAAKWLDNQWPLPVDNRGWDVTDGAFRTDHFSTPDPFPLDTASEFEPTIQFVRIRKALGYSKGFYEHFYKLESVGRGPQNTEAEVVMGVSKIDYIG
jgi:hypothetical protein